MDKIIIVKLNMKDVNEFCNCCKTFDSDIDLIDGCQTFDAKDYDHVILMAFEKEFCVSINSNSKEEILSFNQIMNKYVVN